MRNWRGLHEGCVSALRQHGWRFEHRWLVKRRDRFGLRCFDRCVDHLLWGKLARKWEASAFAVVVLVVPVVVAAAEALPLQARPLAAEEAEVLMPQLGLRMPERCLGGRSF